MKRRLIFIIFTIFHLTLIYGGGWTCQRFKLEIKTLNETITGYIELGDNFKDCKENEILKYIKGNYKPLDTITIYDTIYNLNYPKMDGYKFTAILEQDILKIPIREINNINFINKCPCQEWIEKRDSNNYEYYYAWIGHTMPITELTYDEINLLMGEPVYMTSFGDPLSELRGYQIISYADKLSAERIEGIINDFRNLLLNYSEDQPKYLLLNARYSQLKKELRNQKVIIFKIDYVA